MDDFVNYTGEAVDEDAMFEEDLEDLPSGLRVGEPLPIHPATGMPNHSLPTPMTHPQPGSSYIPHSIPNTMHQMPYNPLAASAPPSSAAPYNSVTAQNGAMPPLRPQMNMTSTIPQKRPRGRPKKVPGTEGRASSSTAGSPARGRPRGSRARATSGRSRGTRGRGRASRKNGESDEDENDDDSDSTEGGEKRSVEGASNGSNGVVNMNEELPDDFNPTHGKEAAGPTTKFGRKISKPTPFVPSNKPTVHRRKKMAVEQPDATLMCQKCHAGHSPPPNRLVICESCMKGWHQICHDPQITDEVVDSELPWYCSNCDQKLANARPPVNVNEGSWSAGSYTAAEKREWLEHLPLHSLIGFILSIEQKYEKRVTPAGLEIWPVDLSELLASSRAAKQAESDSEKKQETADKPTQIETPATEPRPSAESRPSPKSEPSKSIEPSQSHKRTTSTASIPANQAFAAGSVPNPRPMSSSDHRTVPGQATSSFHNSPAEITQPPKLPHNYNSSGLSQSLPPSANYQSSHQPHHQPPLDAQKQMHQVQPTGQMPHQQSHPQAHPQSHQQSHQQLQQPRTQLPALSSMQQGLPPNKLPSLNQSQLNEHRRLSNAGPQNPSRSSSVSSTAGSQTAMAGNGRQSSANSPLMQSTASYAGPSNPRQSYSNQLPSLNDIASHNYGRRSELAPSQMPSLYDQRQMSSPYYGSSASPYSPMMQQHPSQQQHYHHPSQQASQTSNHGSYPQQSNYSAQPSPNATFSPSFTNQQQHSYAMHPAYRVSMFGQSASSAQSHNPQSNGIGSDTWRPSSRPPQN